MPGAWLIGAAAGLTLLVWDQARLRRFARRAAIASPDRVMTLARRRLAESVGAGSALAAVALAALVIASSRTATAQPWSGLVWYGSLLAVFACTWAFAAWAMTRRYTPGLRGRARGPHV